jgi:mono/diheme cytochrome c family protein
MIRPALSTSLLTATLLGGALLGFRALAGEAPSEPKPLVALAQLTPLETAGKDLFLSEGCADCHRISGLPRTTVLAPEARTDGPSLDWVGGKYPVTWHYNLLTRPSSMIRDATMPAYPQLFSEKRTIGADPAGAMEQQAAPLVSRLAGDGFQTTWDSKGIALAAFLMRVGDEERQAAYDAAQAERARKAARTLEAYTKSVDEQDPVLLAAGAEIYAQACSACHGADLAGSIGPNLVDGTWIHGGTYPEILATVRNGVPSKGCPSWGPVLGPKKTAQVAGFVFAKGQ